MQQPRTLDYSTAPPPSQWLRWLVLIGRAAANAGAYWSLNDGGLYIENYGPGGQDWYKGQLPLWWQVLESAVVGICTPAVLYGLFRLARWCLR